MSGTPTVPYDKMSTTSFGQPEPLFTKCCCCIPLRIGCFVLGYLSMVLNVLHTLAFIMVTTAFGIYTHGFNHIDADNEADVLPPEAQTPVLNRIGLILILVIIINVLWLAINIACLVGLHKRRPGPVRMYVTFATVRLLLSVTGFIYLVLTDNLSTQAILSHSFDYALTGYFTMVYYVYAMQMEKEQEEMKHQPVETAVIDAIYPKIDKLSLVS